MLNLIIVNYMDTLTSEEIDMLLLLYKQGKVTIIPFIQTGVYIPIFIKY